jgi:hypothetical protein
MVYRLPGMLPPAQPALNCRGINVRHLLLDQGHGFAYQLFQLKPGCFQFSLKRPLKPFGKVMKEFP